jgi:uncharacterized protein YcgL (UPF0745 family)
VYRSVLREGLYLYVASDFSLDLIPAELRKRLGSVKLVMHLDLSAVKNLVQTDPRELQSALEKNGYLLCIRDPKALEETIAEAVKNLHS